MLALHCLILSGIFMSDLFLEASADTENADIILTGIRYDGTSSFRAGSRHAPEEIRRFSWNLETFSPYFLRDLHSIKYADAGDLDTVPGHSEGIHNNIYNYISRLKQNRGKLITMGGEHSITYPVLKAHRELLNDTIVIVFDAHADLRESYGGTPLSHASVMKRVSELIGLKNMIFMGQRSFTSDEWDELQGAMLYSRTPIELPLEKIRHRNIYISIDLDILDPSIMPGTGTPEADGWSFSELMGVLMGLRECNIIGADIVELCPPFDLSGISAAAASKLIREMMLLLTE